QPQTEIDALVRVLGPLYGRWLAKVPAPEDVSKICQEVARHLATMRALLRRNPKIEDTERWEELDAAQALALPGSAGQALADIARGTLQGEPPTLTTRVLEAVQAKRLDLWKSFVRDQVNPELFYRGVEAFCWAGVEELGHAAQGRGLLDDTDNGRRYAE